MPGLSTSVPGRAMRRLRTGAASARAARLLRPFARSLGFDDDKPNNCYR